MFALLRSLAKESLTKGMVLSPFSLNRGLGAVKEGSPIDSSSYIELENFLESKSLPKYWESINEYIQKIQSDEKLSSHLKFYQVVLWNQHFLGKEPKKPYMEKLLNTEWLFINPKDIKETEEHLNTLNVKIATATNSLIPKLITLEKDEMEGLAFIIANAIYFKADWKYAFPKELTKKRKFYAIEEKEILLDTMDSGLKNEIHGLYSTTNTDGILFELEYKNAKNIRFGIWMPPKSNERKAWTQFIESLSWKKLSSFMESLERTDIRLRMPKFEVNIKFNNLKDKLMECKLNDIFFASKFNFSNASFSSNGVMIAKVIHQVVFKIDEKGTEAAAATAIVSTKESCRKKPKKIEINVDRPYLYYLRDTSTDLNPIGLLFVGLFTGK